MTPESAAPEVKILDSEAAKRPGLFARIGTQFSKIIDSMKMPVDTSERALAAAEKDKQHREGMLPAMWKDITTPVRWAGTKIGNAYGAVSKFLTPADRPAEEAPRPTATKKATPINPAALQGALAAAKAHLGGLQGTDGHSPETIAEAEMKIKELEVKITEAAAKSARRIEKEIASANNFRLSKEQREVILNNAEETKQTARTLYDMVGIEQPAFIQPRAEVEQPEENKPGIFTRIATASSAAKSWVGQGIASVSDFFKMPVDTSDRALAAAEKEKQHREGMLPAMWKDITTPVRWAGTKIGNAHNAISKLLPPADRPAEEATRPTATKKAAPIDPVALKEKLKAAETRFSDLQGTSWNSAETIAEAGKEVESVKAEISKAAPVLARNVEKKIASASNFRLSDAQRAEILKQAEEAKQIAREFHDIGGIEQPASIQPKVEVTPVAAPGILSRMTTAGAGVWNKVKSGISAVNANVIAPIVNFIPSARAAAAAKENSNKAALGLMINDIAKPLTGLANAGKSLWNSVSRVGEKLPKFKMQDHPAATALATTILLTGAAVIATTANRSESKGLTTATDAGIKNITIKRAGPSPAASNAYVGNVVANKAREGHQVTNKAKAVSAPEEAKPSIFQQINENAYLTEGVAFSGPSENVSDKILRPSVYEKFADNTPTVVDLKTPNLGLTLSRMIKTSKRL